MHFLVYLGKFCEAQTKFCLVTNLPDVTASPDSLLWFVALCKLNKMYPVSALLKSLISLKQLHALMTSCLLLCCKRNAPENKKKYAELPTTQWSEKKPDGSYICSWTERPWLTLKLSSPSVSNHHPLFLSLHCLSPRPPPPRVL